MSLRFNKLFLCIVNCGQRAYLYLFLPLFKSTWILNFFDVFLGKIFLQKSIKVQWMPKILTYTILYKDGAPLIKMIALHHLLCVLSLRRRRLRNLLLRNLELLVSSISTLLNETFGSVSHMESLWGALFSINELLLCHESYLPNDCATSAISLSQPVTSLTIFWALSITNNKSIKFLFNNSHNSNASSGKSISLASFDSTSKMKGLFDT